jgi:hypothetical protein
MIYTSCTCPFNSMKEKSIESSMVKRLELSVDVAGLVVMVLPLV